MNSQLCLFFLVIFGVIADNSGENPQVPTWSEWVETADSPCSDVCGYCGIKLVATRSCSTLGKCSGIAQKYEECGSKMCSFPRKTCCPGYVKGLMPNNLDFECVALAKIDVKTSIG